MLDWGYIFLQSFSMFMKIRYFMKLSALVFAMYSFIWFATHDVMAWCALSDIYCAADKALQSPINDLFTSSIQWAWSNSSPRVQEALWNATRELGRDSTTTTVIVTEEIPGARCTCIDQSDTTCKTIETRKYKCEVVKWLSGCQQIFASIIKYFIYIRMLTGVVAVVGLGIAWAIYGSAEEHFAKTLKWYAINLIIGLTILFLFSYILRFLAPWIYN